MAAITFDIILASTFNKDIARQFSRSERSYPFLSIKVMIACFWESDISSFLKHSFAHLEKESLIIGQNFL